MESTRSEISFKEQTLVAYYEEAIREHGLGKYLAEQVVIDKYAQSFLNHHFQNERGNKKIRKCLKLMTPFRAIHTVSAFLLGLTIRDKLQFDTRKWRHLPKETSAKGSFDLFWSWICLFHDVGYYYEDNTQEKFSDIRSLDELMKRLEITYNLLDVSEHKELIERYFDKRLAEKKKLLDHGIAGAVLLYDALMELSESDGMYSQIKYYKSFYVKICDTIALHNMWRATEDTMEEYYKHQLFELIPKNKNTEHIIYYNDDPFLYLLALVDSLDPIKGFCRDNRYRHAIPASYVMDNVYLKFVRYSSKKQILVKFDDPVFSDYLTTQLDPETGLMAWLGVYASCVQMKSGEQMLKIDIDLEGSNIRQKKSA